MVRVPLVSFLEPWQQQLWGGKNTEHNYCTGTLSETERRVKLTFSGSSWICSCSDHDEGKASLFKFLDFF